MGLAEIVQRIAADADKEHAEIVEAARQEADEIRARADSEASRDREGVIAEARAQAARERDQTLARARLDARNSVLAAKREALDDIEELALEKLVGMPAGEYRALLAVAVARRARGDEAVVQDKAETKRLGAALVEDANTLLAEAGKPAKLTLADEHADLGGAGVMLVGDGTEESVAPRGLIADARHVMEPEVARVLFAHKDAS